MNRLTDQAIIKLCHDVQIGTGGMDYADALTAIGEELTLRDEQETPQEAWKRGFEEGVGELAMFLLELWPGNLL